MSLDARALPERVRRLAAELAGDDQSLPAYVYDLAGLAWHTAAVRAALPAGTELLYAVKANPDPRILAALRPHVDGFECSSAGELRHVREVLPTARLALGGPGRAPAELELAVRLGVDRVHVESVHQLRLLAAVTAGHGGADVLLRVNLPAAVEGAALAMGGRPTAFGMDEPALDACTRAMAGLPQLRLRGLHAHLASGLDAGALLEVAREVAAFARAWRLRHGVAAGEINLGGGMRVDYGSPGARFDWAAFGSGLSALAGEGEGLRVEPGRALTAYCGWYLARVLDVKRTHGEVFAVLEGGTHHLRTPAARGHDQPFAVVPVEPWPWPWSRPEAAAEPVTVAGQLCTPRDVLAGPARVDRLRAGDVVAFALAGAYAWNISHHDFLMHRRPAFHYLGAGDDLLTTARRPAPPPAPGRRGGRAAPPG
jgi:diaminopimelate decarboxylase